MSKITQVDMTELMPDSYVDYAIDVIKDRALPNVFDGMKPVHRRILYGLNELKLYPKTSYKKCARIVGEVLGKYHPHGDSSVYDALVRMAQDFSLRYPLVDGHGNFGSVDGDGAAAMRYTEAKMSECTLEILKDIEKDTVDFIPNFDGEEKEPVVLPCRFPNLLVNGSSGIAVGYASNMPPHNLNEVIDGIIFQLKNPDCNIKELMQFIKAPDFPTGATIINKNDIEDIYNNGEGKIIVRAKHHIEYIKEKNKEKECIVFTEIPYQVNKAKVIESIADLITDQIKEERGKKIKVKEKISDVDDVRDESDKLGMRIVVELKKKGDSERILNLLYKYTKLQDSFSVNNVAVANEMPIENLSLKQLIQYYIEHQKEVIKRKTLFDKSKCEKRLHILNGLLLALDKLDLTIQLIRASKNKNEAKEQLQNKLSIDEVQSQAILDMKLQRLTGLEKEGLMTEFNELTDKIKHYNNILNNEQILIEELIKDLIDIKEKFGDERRTEIEDVNTIIDTDLLIEDYNTVIQLTNDGYIKKLRATSVKSTNKDRLKEGDYILSEIKGTNKDTIILFSNSGNAYRIKVSDLKELKPNELGELIINYHDLSKNEKIISMISTTFENNEFIISVFENGKIAKIDIAAFDRVTKVFKYNAKNIIAISNITKDCDVLLVSKEGKALIVNTSDFNPKQNRSVNGDMGIKLPKESIEDNNVVKAFINIPEDLNLKITTEKGKSKEFYLDDVAPTGKPNENRSTYDYIKGKRKNKGKFLINTRNTTDTVKNVEIL